METRTSTLRIFGIVTMIYMVLAFLWWAFLLFQKNNEVLAARLEMLEVRRDLGPKDFSADTYRTAYEEIMKHHTRQKWMILGEVSVFSLTLLIGLWLINRAYRREMETARQQRNFLLSITHELKSPIASIRLVLETFLKRDLLREQKEKLAGGALAETSRLQSLVNDLLLSARLESSYRPAAEKIDLPGLIDSLCRDFSQVHPKVDLHVKHPSDLPAILGDELGLRTIFQNLLENSFKYNRSDRKQIDLSTSHANGEIRIQLSDNGIGIPEAERNRIFQKFYRIGNEDTRQTKGTGLGLYIVKEILAAHRGRIAVGERTGGGTVFTIYLPVLQRSFSEKKPI